MSVLVTLLVGAVAYHLSVTVMAFRSLIKSGDFELRQEWPMMVLVALLWPGTFLDWDDRDDDDVDYGSAL